MAGVGGKEPFGVLSGVTGAEETCPWHLAGPQKGEVNTVFRAYPVLGLSEVIPISYFI